MYPKYVLIITIIIIDAKPFGSECVKLPFYRYQ